MSLKKLSGKTSWHSPLTFRDVSVCFLSAVLQQLRPEGFTVYHRSCLHINTLASQKMKRK